MGRHGPSRGLSRRGFLGSVGAGTLGAALTRPTAEAATPLSPAGERAPATLLVNGREHRILVEPQETLLHVLRESLGLTGTKPGCERGECGACTVLLGGRPRYSCLTLALEAEGAEITTVEGLLHGEELGPVQQAFVDEDGFQCGFCTPGQVMAAEGFLRATPHPSPQEIRQGMCGNLCRCGAYPHIANAVLRAAKAERTVR